MRCVKFVHWLAPVRGGWQEKTPAGGVNVKRYFSMGEVIRQSIDTAL